MRNRYIVSYDIREPKRLRRVFGTMRGYGDPLQYSVFICELSAREREQMITDLEEIINHDMDRIMIVDMGGIETESAKRIEFLGRQTPLPAREAVII